MLLGKLSSPELEELCQEMAEATKVHLVAAQIEATPGVLKLFRSRLARCVATGMKLSQPQNSKQTLSNKEHTIRSLLLIGFKLFGVYLGVLPATEASFLFSQSARDVFGASSIADQISFNTLKAQLAKQLLCLRDDENNMLNQIFSDGKMVSVDRMAAIFDQWGAAGSLAMRLQMHEYLPLSNSGAAQKKTVQLSTDAETMASDNGVRKALDTLGTCMAYIATEKVRTILVEFVEQEAAQMLVSGQISNSVREALGGIGISQSLETVANVVERKRGKLTSIRDIAQLGRLMIDSKKQLKFVTSCQDAAAELESDPEKGAAASIMRRICAALAGSLKIGLSYWEKAIEEAGDRDAEPMAQLRSTVATVKENKRNSGRYILGRKGKSLTKDDLKGLNHSSEVGSASAESETESMVDISEIGASEIVEDAMSPPESPAHGRKSNSSSNSNSGHSSSQGKRRRRRKANKTEAISEGPNTPVTINALTTANVFELVKQLEERLRLKETRLNQKEERILKIQAQLKKKKAKQKAKFEARELELAKRERRLVMAEAASQATKIRLSKMQEEGRMAEVLKLFADRQDDVVPVQRFIRRWLARRALAASIKLAATSEHPALKAPRLRNQCLKEIHSTETEYMRRLEMCNQYKMRLLDALQSKSPPCTAAQIDTMFEGLDDVLRFNTTLRNELEERWEEWPMNTRVGDIFVARAPFFGLYDGFVRNFDNSSATFQEVMNRKPFVDLTNSMLAEGMLGLDTVLIAPIQRLPRYEMMLKTLLKRTPEDHADFHDLTIASQKISDAAQKMNARKADAEQINALWEIEKIIKRSTVDLVRPRRVLLKRGPLGSLTNSKEARRYYFFFNDLIVETTPRKLAHDKYDFIRAAPLSDQWTVKSAAQVRDYGFVIQGVAPQSTWEQPSFLCQDSDEFNDWCKTLLAYTKERNTTSQ